MAWHGTGEDRVKRFKVYQELESRYQAVLEEIEALKETVRLKDATIKHLASELIATLPDSPIPNIGPLEPTNVTHVTHVPAVSESQPVVRPSGLRPVVKAQGQGRVPLSRIYGEK